MNKKGITIVEMIVSIALISVVLIFLLRLLLTLREMVDHSLSMINYQILSSDIIKKLQTEIKDQNDCSFTLTNSNSDLNIKCGDYVNMKLNVNNNLITLTDYINKDEKGNNGKATWEFEKDAEISKFNLKNDGNLTMITLNIIDDKGINYPMEISYLKTD